MPKNKTHKGIAKRFRISAKGKVKHKRCCAGHLMSTKSGNRKRYLRRPCFLQSVTAAKIKMMLNT